MITEDKGENTRKNVHSLVSVGISPLRCKCSSHFEIYGHPKCGSRTSADICICICVWFVEVSISFDDLQPPRWCVCAKRKENSVSKGGDGPIVRRIKIKAIVSCAG